MLGFSRFKHARDGKSDDFIISFENPYGLCMAEALFVDAKLCSLYKRILSDCYSKSRGWITDDQTPRVSDKIKTPEEKIIASLWDNFTTIQDPQGLISILADAMVCMRQVCIMYDKDTGVVSEAKGKDRDRIESDYKKKGSSEHGIAINFRKYYKTMILKLYLTLLYTSLGTALTNLRIAQALKFKISRLREAVSKMASTDVQKQAMAITDALKSGASVAIDSEDDLSTNQTNDGSVKQMMIDFYSEIASELGVSLSYVNAELTSGMNVNGEADSNYNEQGIKNFFDSIFKPVCDELYKVDLRFESDKRFYRMLQYATSIIAIENSSLLSGKEKTLFKAWLLDISDEEVDEITEDVEIVEDGQRFI